MTKVLQCQFLPKELNPENFTLLYTIGNFNFYGMTDLGASVNVMPRNIFEYLRLANLRNTNMLVEMSNMTKKAPLDIQRDSTYWWHDHVFKEEECDEMGIKIEKYDPHNVQVETFKVKKYSFKSGQSFVCVTKEVDDALPLERKNRPRFQQLGGNFQDRLDLGDKLFFCCGLLQGLTLRSKVAGSIWKTEDGYLLQHKGKGSYVQTLTKPREKRDALWFKEKVLLVQAQAHDQIPNEEELAFLADPYIPEVIPDSEETLALAEESRSKMLSKHKDNMMLEKEKQVDTTPIDYVALNKDFSTRFVPQTELSAEQAFWSKNSVNSSEPTLSIRPTNVEVPKELPKEKDLAITTLKDELRKLKGKALVDNNVSNHPSDPELHQVNVEQ
ncbi:hypothetical protein Tco_0992365 [Tanacetum coccineum]|uniref:Uncharacterized protein n=1 Tax=Tanacetum coccineum TaxID=301880 RepID=A0ABQ5F1W0_9ASTR